MRTRQWLTFLFIALLLAVQVAASAGIEAQATVSIYDIQYTTDPSGDSPYKGQTVTTSGVVSLVGSDGYVIQDRQGGAWNGVYVYDSGHSPHLGDEIEITGEVAEYYGLTELKNIASLVTLSTGNGIPTAEVTATEAMTETHEGVLVAVYAVTVTDPSLGHGEWEISDASGSARVDDEFYAYSPTQDQNLTMVRGVVWYGYGSYKIEPRSAADIVDAATFRIYDIQYPGGDSPYAGQTVTVTGTVVGVYYGGYVLEDPSGGPWAGVYVYDGTNTPSEGDEVTLTGQVSEYYGLTQISSVSAFNVNSSGNPLPTPEGVSTDWIATGRPRAESYEGVLIATDVVTVTNDSLGHGEWEITDRSGTGARVDDMAGYSYSPVNGHVWQSVRGVLWYSYSDYKIEPRYDADIGLFATEPAITKDAPVLVAPGELFTYTITVENELGFPLNDVVVTDAVPANATFAYALDGGVESSGVVSWTVASLPHTGSITVRFAVTATNSAAYVTNANYAVVASNYVVPTAGDALVTVVGTELTIHHIQGASHVSPLMGRDVENVQGVVTAKRSSGFYMQDPNPDGDVATSDAVYVHTGSAPVVDAGDEVSVSGTVMEYRSSATDLSTTQIGGSPTVVVQSGGNALMATVIGTGGRIPPQQVIDDDATGNVETGGTFDPTTDGIDFYESLEAMLVQVNDAVAVGATSKYGEIAIVGDNGANAGLFTPRGGIVVRPNDFNPERIIIDDAIVYSDTVNVGASFTGPITGVLDYSFGNFKFLNVEPLPSTSGGVISETTTAPTINQLHVASFNVYNLDPGDGAARFTGLASQMVNNLQSPDLIGLQEIQDNTGPTDDGVVDATDTYTMLIAAIQAAGGPTYDFRDISPEDGQDGGEPGGNIRVGFLFRTDRGLTFADRPGGDATTAVTVTMGATGVELSCSPGRINPTNPAFDDSRKSLVGEFLWNGRKMFVVVNHLKSKYGDDPLFGRYQPPASYTEIKRDQQAQVVNDFVDSILALDPSANVIVLGDLNDFQFSTPLATLAGGVLTDLVNTLPVTEQYTYIYDGNSQVLDHILVSDNLSNNAIVEFDIVHTNAEFAHSAQRPSDHDPIVATFTLPHRIYLPLVMRQH